MVHSIDDARRRPTDAARVPPHNLEAEESLLGSMMLSREALTAAVEARLITVQDPYHFNANLLLANAYCCLA